MTSSIARTGVPCDGNTALHGVWPCLAAAFGRWFFGLVVTWWFASGTYSASIHPSDSPGGTNTNHMFMVLESSFPSSAGSSSGKSVVERGGVAWAGCSGHLGTVLVPARSYVNG